MGQITKITNQHLQIIMKIATENGALDHKVHGNLSHLAIVWYGQSTEHTVKSPSLYTPMGPMLTPMLRLADGWDDAAY